MEMIKSCLRRNVQRDVFLQQLLSLQIVTHSSETLCTDLLSFIRKEKPLDYAVGACQILSLLQIALALGLRLFLRLISRLVRSVRHRVSHALSAYQDIEEQSLHRGVSAHRVHRSVCVRRSRRGCQ